MFARWEFWGAVVLPLGALSFFAGLAGKWQDSDPPKHADETSWAVYVGLILFTVAALGLAYSLWAGRNKKDPQGSGITVRSDNQRGGITAHTVNLGKKVGDQNGEEE
jgi:hypothetical protein